MKLIKNIFYRIWGYAWGPYDEYTKNVKRYGPPLKSHIRAEWTVTDHFAHDNYQRGHLPQLNITASGWKARILALVFWPDVPQRRSEFVWWKNGDHPYDDVFRPYEDTGKIPTEPREGFMIRYFRHPRVNGRLPCARCGYKMNDHGWIDNGKNDGEGVTVCPGTKLTY